MLLELVIKILLVVSDPVTYTIEKKKEYNSYLNGSLTTNYSIGETIDPKLYNGSMVKVLLDGVDITSQVSITIKITDGENNEVTTIPNDSPGEYKVTYRIVHNTYIKTLSNQIIIN